MIKARHTIVLIVIGILFFFHACKEEGEQEIDTQKPNVELGIPSAFPTSCDTLYFGEPFTVKVRLTDNAQLAAYNIDIHQNFDQHTHSTEFDTCILDAKKSAINPYLFIQDYTIPNGSKDYTTDLSLTMPKSDGTNLYDEGDYHFQMRVTDQEGWSSMRGFNVKILHR